MAYLDVQYVEVDGSAITYDPADGVNDDWFPADRNNTLRVKNTGAATRTFTITAGNPCNFGVVHTITGSVAAGDEISYGSFNPRLWGQPAPSVPLPGITPPGLWIQVVYGTGYVDLQVAVTGVANIA